MWLSEWYMCNIKINLHSSFLPTAFFLFWSEANAAGQLFFISGMVQVVFILKQHQIDTWAHSTELHSLILCLSTCSDALTFPLSSFCIGWIGFTLQEFLRMKVIIIISENTKATGTAACVYIWARVLIRRESRERQKSSQTSLLCFVVFPEFACSAKCAELGKAKAD